MATTTVRRRRAALAADLATLTMVLGFAAGPAEAAPPPKADYVALGDSYSAGTGAGPFSPTSNCVQTKGGYVDIVGNTGRVNFLAKKACHGALLTDEGDVSPIPTVLEQIGDSSAALSAAKFVSITAGANDVDFSSVFVACANPLSDCSAAIANAEGKFAGLASKLMVTYQALRMAAPTAKIVVLGYPHLFDAAVGVPGIDQVALGSITSATDALNSVIAYSATSAGAQFVDMTGRFAGHEANSSDPWIVFNGNFVDPTNLHPNKAGHSLGYASALMEAAKPAQLARQ
ncbi:SGNH/GDSL hydrolase family protein [Pseudarthrobacter sp. IC2-21]|uniref:SGNH/GDSL hydrolase family protein n=1 Tax=Pseudarthrobacter sp. IC2-21 TaxID=3092262 RepID=UPI002A69B86D|nr:SGNH/GDSL hydrolase family protein [Pseudarthrobacter sp. IC2-21]